MTEHPQEHPQIVIDHDNNITADEQIAPLVAMVRRYGLITRYSCQGGGAGTYALAYITFPATHDALEFLLQTAYLMDYCFGDEMALTVNRPLGTEEGPGGKVTWHPNLTARIISAWTAA